MPGRPREIADVELPGIWHCGGGDILRIFGVSLIEAQPVPGLHLPGVRRVMRDMLSLRRMTEPEHREMRRRVDLLSDHGRSALAIVPTLINRARHALLEPFWYPTLMTNQELRAHLDMSSEVASTAGGLGLIAGIGTGAASAIESARGAAATMTSAASIWATGLAATVSTVAATHYESRATAYRVELALRGATIR